jgi:polyphosphate kinase 2 (PPK2 family)
VVGTWLRRVYNQIVTILFKFWLHISQDKQLCRSKDREQTDYKRWKITQEDWRNRDKWGDYQRAVDDMLLKTSTPDAPWTIVEANDKPFARVKVLETVACKLEGELT